MECQKQEEKEEQERYLSTISEDGQKLSLSAIKVSNEKLAKLIEKMYNKSFWIEDVEKHKRLNSKIRDNCCFKTAKW